MASFRSALDEVTSGVALLFEWDLRAHGEIHAIEPLLPHTDAIGARFPIGHKLSADAIGRLARLAKRAAKPIRFRLDWSEESGSAADIATRAGEAAGRLARIAVEEGCTAIGFLLAGRGSAAVGRTVARFLDTEASTRGIPLFFELPADPIEASVAGGAACIDRLADGLCSSGRCAASPGNAPDTSEGTTTGDPAVLTYTILQGCRLRLTRAEFIVCPSCGRTQFDLQATTRRIQEKTAHLAGVKIAIMGCIVNGPGEMADADFGYIGSGPGRVDLYAGRTRVLRAVDAEEADERLIELIREHGKWSEPPAEHS
jgi:4-hydroxy-3-methylbut-2-en-1-yl diphosphate synthase IspG/GcpE